MKILIPLLMLIILTGCTDNVTKEECLNNNHDYITYAMSGKAVTCADVNLTTRIVITYDSAGIPNGMGELDKYVNIVPIGND